MSRKNNDKRVLVSRGKRRSRSMNNRRNDYNSIPVQPKRNDYFHSGGYGRQYNSPKKNNNGILILVVIIALIAFIIGAGIGVSLSLDTPIIVGEQSSTSQYDNVTNEMASSNQGDTAYSNGQVSNSNSSYNVTHYSNDYN